MVALTSSRHKGEGRALAVVWFQDSFDEPLLERFVAAVRSVPDWESIAIPWED